MDDNRVTAAIKLADGKTRYTATAGDNTPFSIDFPPPVGTENGYNPLELLLLSFASCTATSLITLLRDRMRCTVTDVAANASGDVADEHPKTFTRIVLHMDITSPDATEDKVERALKTAEEKICSIWALIRGNVAVETTFTIHR